MEQFKCYIIKQNLERLINNKGFRKQSSYNNKMIKFKNE